MTRPYLCRLCSSPEHRAEHCSKVSRAFIVARRAWIARHEKPGVSKQALDQQWRREHGFCGYCPRRVRRGHYCTACSDKRKRQPSRAQAYRKEHERG